MTEDTPQMAEGAVRPALSAAEWDDYRRWSLEAAGASLEPVQVAALANAELPDGDPRKIVRNDYEVLDRVSRLLQAYARDEPLTGDAYDAAHSAFYDLGRLAAKLAALLPPREAGR